MLTKASTPPGTAEFACGLYRAALLLAVLGVFAACGHSSSPSDGSSSVDFDGQIAREFDPATGADAYAYLLDYAAIGLHRTGSAQDKQTSQWVSAELDRLGYEVSSAAVDFQQFTPRSITLSVGQDPFAAFPIYYAGITSPDGIEAELVDVGAGSPLDFAQHDVAGKIVLAELPLVLDFFAPTLAQVMQSAAQGGAAGLIAAIQGPENEAVAQNVNADVGLCNLPSVVVGKVDGANLSALNGQLAHLTVDATIDTGQSENVIARLAGSSDDVLVVGTPTNGWFGAEAERGAGVGALLTLARYYADRYADTPPPQTLLFTATAGHEIGFLGLKRFVADNPDLLPRISAYIHLGASLSAENLVEIGGEAMRTGTVEENRGLFVSENPVLQSLTQAAMSANAVQPLASIPPSTLNPGEQQYMYAAGVPIVSISGAHFWLHTPRDAIDMTSPELLDPVVKAFRDVIDGVLALPGTTIRQSNAIAADGARPIEDPRCP